MTARPTVACLAITVDLSHPRLRQLLWLTLMASIALIYLVAPVRGQQANDRRREAATRLADVDGDFPFLGEYLGVVCDANGVTMAAGLQVVPHGDGKFIGMHYACGLPGSGWNRRDRESLSGERQGNVVSLTGDETRIQIQPSVALVYNVDGGVLGSLNKVQRQSPTLGMPAPPNAYTLFDGTDTSQFKRGKTTEEGWLREGTELIAKFRDFTLHAEFRLPYMPHARGQGRANSGFYLQSSYEVQVLDSFGLEGVENECGALYRYRRPDVNMCLPPLAWQTYDITFRSPRFDYGGNKVQNARITVLHNGVVVHDHFDVERKTGAGKPETNQLWPIKLQDHSNPVRFRNIWLIDLAAHQPGLATSCVW